MSPIPYALYWSPFRAGDGADSWQQWVSHLHVDVHTYSKQLQRKAECGQPTALTEKTLQYLLAVSLCPMYTHKLLYL